MAYSRRPFNRFAMLPHALGFSVFHPAGHSSGCTTECIRPSDSIIILQFNHRPLCQHQRSFTPCHRPPQQLFWLRIILYYHTFDAFQCELTLDCFGRLSLATIPSICQAHLRYLLVEVESRLHTYSAKSAQLQASGYSPNGPTYFDDVEPYDLDLILTIPSYFAYSKKWAEELSIPSKK